MREKKVKIHMTLFEICNTIVLFLIAVLFFVGVMWMGGMLMGSGGVSYETYFGTYKPMIIVSESMTPTIEVNSLLMVENKKYSDLEIGDIILFNTQQYGLVIHRIVEETELGYKTKGDNNELEDGWIVYENMYKGCVAKIYNEFSPIITFLFGDLDNINIVRLLVGFFMLAFIILFIISILIWIYMYICTYTFIKISSKKGGENVINEYYPYMKRDISEKELIELFDKLSQKNSFFVDLKLRYKIMRLHKSLELNRRSRNKVYSVYNSIRKELN